MKKTINTRVPLVTTYHPQLRTIGSILHKHLPLLHASNLMTKIFPEVPLTAYRRPRNLRDLLVKARVKPIATDVTPKPTGSYKCIKKCVICRDHMVESKKYTSSVTKRSYPITQHLSCKSTWVIYLITCRKCNKQYIGKTNTTLYTRISNTRSQIKNFHTPQNAKLPYAQHFNLPDHTLADLSIMPIEQIHKHTNEIILHRESKLIAKLSCLTPFGINVDA